MRAVTICETTFPFRNIAWYRYGCPSHLTNQPIQFLRRKALRRTIDADNEFHRALPDSKIAVGCGHVKLSNWPTSFQHGAYLHKVSHHTISNTSCGKDRARG